MPDLASELFGDIRTEFEGELYSWRGPAPFHFIKLPDAAAAGIHALAPLVTYGWGVIPVSVRIGDTDFETSLFPKDGGYVLPIKDAVRKGEELALGDIVTVELAIRTSRRP